MSVPSSQRNPRLAVLASGRGSNLQALIDAIEEGNLSATIALVVSNKQEAHALERARRHGLKHVFVDPAPFKGQALARESYDQAVLDLLQQHEIEVVLMAGYMRIVTPVLINAFPNRMMNIHPSLLPSFTGLDVQRTALDWGVKIAGCTVHFVTEGVDEGPIILQAAVPVLEEDTPETLSVRILQEEHRIFPQAVQLYAEGRLQVEGRRVRISERAGPAP